MGRSLGVAQFLALANDLMTKDKAIEEALIKFKKKFVV
jgi:hypothetical protein